MVLVRLEPAKELGEKAGLCVCGAGHCTYRLFAIVVMAIVATIPIRSHTARCRGGKEANGCEKDGRREGKGLSPDARPRVGKPSCPQPRPASPCKQEQHRGVCIPAWGTSTVSGRLLCAPHLRK